MMENQAKYSKLKERYVIKFLVAEKWKPCEIYNDAYKEALA